MKETHLKYRLSKIILFSQLGLLLLILFYFFLGGFTRSELTTLLMAFLPIGSFYLTIVVKYAYENRYLTDGEPVASVYSSISTFILIALYLITLLTISLKALFNYMEFEELKVVVLFTQFGMGVYAGYFLTDLFSRKEK